MDISTFLNVVAWLWNKGWWGKAISVLGGFALLVCAWFVPALSAYAYQEASSLLPAVLYVSAKSTGSPTADPKSTSPAKETIKGKATCCSERDNWPIVIDVHGYRRTVPLSGIEGPIAAKARDRFAAWISSHGGYLECDSDDGGQSYRCLTPQRIDVAQALLLNGAAHATTNAPDAYSDAQKQAQKMRRGS